MFGNDAGNHKNNNYPAAKKEDQLLVSAENLQLGYDGHIAVAASTFQLHQRGVVTIIGPNGSGKSTLLHALAGITKPLSGKLTILGKPPQLQRKKISYVMQSISISAGIPLSVKETVRMGRYPRLGWFGWQNADDKAAIAAAMSELDISHLANRQISELSGGQRQRVYVAQGLCQPHQVLLLDEPLTGLDLLSQRKIDDLIHREAETGTVIITTHDIAEAEAADQVILMCGKVLACGKPENVLTQKNLETAYGLGQLHEHRHQKIIDDGGHH